MMRRSIMVPLVFTGIAIFVIGYLLIPVAFPPSPSEKPPEPLDVEGNAQYFIGEIVQVKGTCNSELQGTRYNDRKGTISNYYPSNIEGDWTARVTLDATVDMPGRSVVYYQINDDCLLHLPGGD